MQAILHHPSLPAGLVRIAPGERVTLSFDDVDVITDFWQAPTATALVIGQAHPLYPGCVIERLDREKMCDGLWEFGVTAAGDVSVTQAGAYGAAKFLGAQEGRTLGQEFETLNEKWIAWGTEPMHYTTARNAGLERMEFTTVTAYAGSTPLAHGFTNNQPVVLLNNLGSALTTFTEQRTTRLGAVYRVSVISTSKFALFNSDGYIIDSSETHYAQVIPAAWLPGTPHPTIPGMYLTAATPARRGSGQWRHIELQFAGRRWDKGYHRVITVGGQEVSPEGPITVSMSGGWGTPARGTLALPEIIMQDTLLVPTAINVAGVPGPGSPVNPPIVQTVTLAGTADQLLKQWPSGWSLMAVEHVATLNQAITLNVQRATWRYRWPEIYG